MSLSITNKPKDPVGSDANLQLSTKIECDRWHIFCFIRSIWQIPSWIFDFFIIYTHFQEKGKQEKENPKKKARFVLESPTPSFDYETLFLCILGTLNFATNSHIQRNRERWMEVSKWTNGVTRLGHLRMLVYLLSMISITRFVFFYISLSLSFTL